MVAITPPFTRSFSLPLSLLLSGNSRLHHAQTIYPANPRAFRGRFAIPRKYLANLDVNLALIGRGDLSLSQDRLKVPGISYLSSEVVASRGCSYSTLAKRSPSVGSIGGTGKESRCDDRLRKTRPSAPCRHWRRKNSLYAAARKRM